MITLLPYQIHAKESIDWLISDKWDHRQVGRSYLMATIFIEKAMINPTIWIPVWDHGPHHPKKEYFMLETIKNIVDTHYPDWNLKIKTSSYCFCMNKR